MLIDLIDVGDRYRLDPDKGLDELKESINNLGLLQPIVVTPPKADGHFDLIADDRRLRAMRALGFDVIEARIVHDLSEADKPLAEYDENVCRLPFTTGEARRLFNACKNFSNRWPRKPANRT